MPRNFGPPSKSAEQNAGENHDPEHISRLLDADLPGAELRDGLTALAAGADLREAATVYQIIGDALRGRPVEDDGYSRRIFKALDREVIKR